MGAAKGLAKSLHMSVQENLIKQSFTKGIRDRMKKV